MPLMKFDKKFPYYRGRPVAAGDTIDVESRFVRVLQHLKVASPVAAAAAVGAVAERDVARRTTPVATPVAEGVAVPTQGTIVPPEQQPVEQPPQVEAQQPDVVAADPVVKVEGVDDEDKEKDVGQYETREMTAQKRRYTRRTTS
jgi:hypothetical protein